MTSKNRSFRLSPALVLSCVALFMALTGSALAVGVGKNTVRSPQIVDGTIRTIDLRDNSVAAGKIAPDAVDTTEIAENGVDSSDVAPDTLAAGDLAAASVASSEVADQSLTANDLGPDSVGSSELQAGSVRASELGAIIQVTDSAAIASAGNASASVACPAGTTVISGGNTISDYRVALAGSLRSGNGWLVHAHNYAGTAETLTVYAYCLSGGSSN
jgi:trimeric autotransporter adhesin